jgi:hypothetical protein
MITHNAKCTRGIKSRFAMAKAAFVKKNNFFTRKLDANLRKKLIQCYMWSTAFYGAESWALWKVVKKYL